MSEASAVKAALPTAPQEPELATAKAAALPTVFAESELATAPDRTTKETK
jgi:hypothetical protein